MKARNLGLLALVAASISGCGGKGGDGDPAKAASPGRVTVAIQWPKPGGRVVPFNSQSVVVTLKKGAYSNSRVSPAPTGPLYQSVVTFTDVPADTGYTITAQAVPNADGTGTPLATVAQLLDVVSGPNAPFDLSMDSTVTRITGTLGGKRFIVDKATPLPDIVTTPDGPLVAFGTATLVVDTRNAAGQLVLTNDGSPHVSAGSAFASLPATGSDPGNASTTYALSASAEGVGVNVVYAVAPTGETTTFGLPVTIHNYTLTTLAPTSAVDVAPDAVIGGTNGDLIQTLSALGNAPSLGATAANAHTTTTPRIATPLVGATETPAVIDGGNNVFLGATDLGLSGTAIADLAAVGTDLYWVDANRVHRIATATPGTVVNLTNGIVGSDLAVTDGTSRYVVLRNGTTVTRYVQSGTTLTPDAGFGNGSGVVTVTGALDVAALGESVYVLGGDGKVSVFTGAGTTPDAVLDLGLPASPTRRIAVWKPDAKLAIALSDGTSVTVYKEYQP